MAIDRHVGRSTPTFVVEGDPDKYIGLIDRHGLFARIMRARVCACSTNSGQPDMYCDICKGDGHIYDFQRKLLQTDEDSDIRKDRSIVHPFRVPVLEPKKVERLLPPEQGGIQNYDILGFDQNSIHIGGGQLPYHWNKMRVTYYFDRYNFVEKDIVNVSVNTKTLTTTKTLFDDGHRTGNWAGAHGDITIVKRIYDTAKDHEYTKYTFRQNQIFLDDSEPAPTPGKVEVDYFHAPVERVLPSDLETQNDQENWTHALQSGTIRLSLKPWFELSQGDLITFWTTQFHQDAIVIHTAESRDKLNEFNIAKLDDEIFDEDGNVYRKGVDYVLRPFRDIVWLAGGSQPNAGKKMNVRFSYNPTYIIFRENPVPNNLENKSYPVSFTAHRWGMGLPKDVEMKDNIQYPNVFQN